MHTAGGGGSYLIQSEEIMTDKKKKSTMSDNEREKIESAIAKSIGGTATTVKAFTRLGLGKKKPKK